MLEALKILTVIIVAIAMACALAHAFELPGKMRLSKEEYFAVQRIYYPGFILAGLAEPLGITFTGASLIFAPANTLVLWLTLASFLGQIGMQVIFWIFVQPVNRAWLQGHALSGLGRHFFSGGQLKINTIAQTPSWRKLRNRWEYAHLVRAAFAVVSFITLVIASA